MMARRGKVPAHHGIDPYSTGIASEYRRPRRQVVPGSATRTVAHFLNGIRADIEVPRTLLGYFKYR
jgi:hypothetical protein